MKSKLLAGIVACAACAAAADRPAVKDRPDRLEPQTMRQAIAFEKHKQAAAERQARIEQRRSRVRSADRQDQRKHAGDGKAKPNR